MTPGRPYQERAIPALRQLLQTHQSILAVAPTGSGKTHLGLMIAERVLERGLSDVWWLAHRRELIEQPLLRFRAVGIDCAAYGAGYNDTRLQPVRIASVQTVARRDVQPLHSQALVFIDEGHRSVARMYKEGIIKRLKDAYHNRVKFILLTATPYRTDGKDLGDVATALYEVATPKELIAANWIVEPQVFRMPSPKMDTCKLRGGDFVLQEKAEHVDRPKLVADIVETWLRLGDGQPTVGFASSIAHSQHLVERCLAAGIRAVHVDGDTPVADRSRVLARLAIGGQASGHPEALDIVWNVGILTEGWDSESDYARVLRDESFWLGRSFPPDYHPLAVVIDADPTESMGKFRQREGRVTRPHAAKPFGRLLCHTGNFDRHGMLRDHAGFTLRQPLASLDAQKRERGVLLPGCVQCKTCLAVVAVGTVACPYCAAHIKQPVAVPIEDDGELQLALDEGTGQRKSTASEQTQFMAESYLTMWTMNAERAKAGKQPVKPGFIRARYHDKYGFWPNTGVLKRGERLARVILREKA